MSKYQARHDHRPPSSRVLPAALADHRRLDVLHCLEGRQVLKIPDVLHKDTQCWKTIRNNISTVYKDFITVLDINVAPVLRYDASPSSILSKLELMKTNFLKLKLLFKTIRDVRHVRCQTAHHCSAPAKILKKDEKTRGINVKKHIWIALLIQLHTHVKT